MPNQAVSPSLPANHTAPAPRFRAVIPWLFGFLQWSGALALAIWTLAAPPVFSWYYPRLRFAPETGEARRIVQWLSTHETTGQLNVTLRRKLDEKELEHFSDVRRLFQKMPIVALATLAACFLLLWLGDAANAQLPSRALLRGFILCGGVLAVLGGLALADWNLFFRAVHYPFFGADSWRLSWSSYSLHLFPEGFWKLMTCVLLGLTGVLALLWRAFFQAIQAAVAFVLKFHSKLYFGPAKL